MDYRPNMKILKKKLVRIIIHIGSISHENFKYVKKMIIIDLNQPFNQVNHKRTIKQPI